MVSASRLVLSRPQILAFRRRVSALDERLPPGANSLRRAAWAGPRYSTYVVAAADVAVFSLGRLPDDDAGRRKADGIADRLEALLDGRRKTDREAGEALGRHANSLRYAGPTGRVLIRWEGARAPIVWTVPRPEIDPAEARLELARRYLHVFGPTTPESFAE